MLLRRLPATLLRARRAPVLLRPICRACSSSSSSNVDDALRAALAHVAGSVAQQDPQAQQIGQVPGATLTAGAKMLLKFTCTHGDCGDDPDGPRTTTKIISKNSYEQGIVLCRCSHCQSLHLIADRLGWFGERTDVEQILAERGEEVRRMLSTDENAESLLHIE